MNSTTSPVDQDISAVDSALCRAMIYSALALAFRPPTNETVARIIEPENSAALAAAAALIDSHGNTNLAGAIDTLAAAGRAAVSSLPSSYRALFGHTARGIVAPYEKPCCRPPSPST
jgi:TorA maturation chaperone TorD